MNQPSPQDRTPEAEAVDREPSAPIDTFEAVINATLQSTEGAQAVTPEEIEALRTVRRNWGDVPLVLNPIAIELVEAMLLVNYGALDRERSFWQKLAERIAGTLYDSPTSKKRLVNLWKRLGEPQ